MGPALQFIHARISPLIGMHLYRTNRSGTEWTDPVDYDPPKEIRALHLSADGILVECTDGSFIQLDDNGMLGFDYPDMDAIRRAAAAQETAS